MSLQERLRVCIERNSPNNGGISFVLSIIYYTIGISTTLTEVLNMLGQILSNLMKQRRDLETLLYNDGLNMNTYALSWLEDSIDEISSTLSYTNITGGYKTMNEGKHLMGDQKRGSHAVIMYEGDFYCVFNKKHNKWSPIGGSSEDYDDDHLSTLRREFKEEIRNTEIVYKEIHLHDISYRLNQQNYRTSLYLVITEGLPVMNEDFLELHKITDEMSFDYNNSYISLVNIINHLERINFKTKGVTNEKTFNN